MANPSTEKQKDLENRESLLLESLERVRQKALDMLYQTGKNVSEIIRESADQELLDLEIRKK